MEYSEIEKIMALVGSFGSGMLLCAAVIYFFIKSYIPSYLAEKGKNLATKEDIEAITGKVESIKSDYAKVLEELRSNNQLKLAAIEREKNIKKEVYLDAVEAITRSQNIVSSFSNLDISEKQITSSLVNDSGIIAKIQIVGSEDTVKSVTNFMASVGTATLELMLERSALMQRRNRIELLEGLRKKSGQEIERYIAIMKNLNLEGNQDPRLWETINKNIEVDQRQCDKYANELDGLRVIQNKEHLEFTRKCMDRLFEISALLPVAVLSVREELDLKISRDAYMDIYQKNIENGKSVFRKFLENVEALRT